MHNTNYKVVYQLLLNDIREYAKLAMKEPDELLIALTDAEKLKQQQNLKKAKTNHQSSVDRLDELNFLLQKLFEENATGRLNHTNYDRLFARYQEEQEQLMIKVSELEKQIKEAAESENSGQKWIDLIAKYEDLQELDAEIISASYQSR